MNTGIRLISIRCSSLSSGLTANAVWIRLRSSQHRPIDKEIFIKILKSGPKPVSNDWLHKGKKGDMNRTLWIFKTFVYRMSKLLDFCWEKDALNLPRFWGWEESIRPTSTSPLNRPHRQISDYKRSFGESIPDGGSSKSGRHSLK